MITINMSMCKFYIGFVKTAPLFSRPLIRNEWHRRGEHWLESADSVIKISISRNSEVPYPYTPPPPAACLLWHIFLVTISRDSMITDRSDRINLFGWGLLSLSSLSLSPLLLSLSSLSLSSLSLSSLSLQTLSLDKLRNSHAFHLLKHLHTITRSVVTL